MSDKADIKADMECMTTCVAALEKLSRHYSKDVFGDSIEEERAENARCRCLNWVVAYVQSHKRM